MTARYLIGDVLEVLPTLEENSVDLILTSPPFLALRSYLPADHPDKAKEGGSQSTPGAFIDWLVDVVEALDRVLAPHGSMVIELGDTYAGNVNGFNSIGEAHEGFGNRQGQIPSSPELLSKSGNGWPADKSLTLIPELFRMTLVYGFNPLTGRQTKRWRLRNVVRWVRPNPPVGALGDKFRPATSELMVFCRTDEAGRRRYFDLDAVREPYAQPWRIGKTEDNGRGAEYPDDVRGSWSNKPNFTREDRGGAPPLDWWNIPLLDGEEPTPYAPEARAAHRRNAKGVESRPNTVPSANRGGNWATLPITDSAHPLGSPPLDWWNIPPGGYQGAHYAVFPEALCVRPIKAMCPEKVCRTCGEPSRRIVEQTPEYAAFRAKKSVAVSRVTEWADNVGNRDQGWDQAEDSGARGELYVTKGWTDCSHDNYRPGLVLDPFAGSGTTLAVAVGHGRDAVGIDLDERNARLAEERIGFFLQVVGSIT